MNKYQKAVATIAALNLLLMILFPPFVDNPLLRGVPRGFESFYFLPMAPSGRVVFEQLLTIEVAFVLANALAAWLLLNAPAGEDRKLTDGAVLRGLAAFAAVDLLVIGLFPPFEPYSSLVRVPEWGFDGFYFIFGDKRHRQFFAPFLYLEGILVAVNVLVVHLVFGLLNRSVSPADQKLIEIVHHSPPQKVDALVHALEANVEPPPAPAHHPLGRHEDRRHHQDPNYHGPERRTGHDRRHQPS